MPKIVVPPLFAKDSLSCVSPIRNKILGSSREIGWTSLLLDHLEGCGEVEAYDKPPTPDVCISVTLSGAIDLSVLKNGQWRHSLDQPGSTVLTRFGESNRLRWRSHSATAPFSMANLYIPQKMMLEAAEHFRRAGQPIRSEPELLLLSHKPIIATTAATLVDAMHDGLPDLYAEQAARWLATHLVWPHDANSDSINGGRNPGIIRDPRLKRVIEYISVHYNRPLSIATLAAEAAVSPFHFTRLFRQATGFTPHAYLKEIRLTAAYRLLIDTDLSIESIARESGYMRSTAFTTAFVIRFGETPRSHRARNGDLALLRNPAK